MRPYSAVSLRFQHRPAPPVHTHLCICTHHGSTCTRCHDLRHEGQYPRRWDRYQETRDRRTYTQRQVLQETELRRIGSTIEWTFILPHRNAILVLIADTCKTLRVPGPAQAADTKGEIDMKDDAALKAFHKEVPSAGKYLKEAKGVLVIPDVKKGGFVVAAQWGTGALQVNGRTVNYYKIEAGSAGFQAGYQKADFVFIFFSQEALNEFRNSEGWTAGAEAGLTLITVDTGVAADTLKNQNGVVGFAFGKEGLMAGWSGKGTKFARVEPER